jgi:23S rRNA-/tRNA-specific pseudouridylate synthase
VTTTSAQLHNPPPARERDPADRSIAIGVVVTVLFHVLLVVFAPEFEFMNFSGSHGGISIANRSPGKSFDFELTPMTEAEKQRDPFRFVETNSAAPENIPDKTENFSNRNQQSAQEVAAKEIDPLNRPSVKGQDEIKSDTIVSGDMAPPMPAVAPTPETAHDAELERNEMKARMEQVPLSGFDKTEGKDPDGIATNIAKNDRPTTNADRALEGAPGATELEGGLHNVVQAARAAPKERPRLSSVSLNRASPLTNRAAGVTNVGIVGRDARWSEYGEYLNELIEIVQASWYNILRESRVAPPRGSQGRDHHRESRGQRRRQTGCVCLPERHHLPAALPQVDGPDDRRARRVAGTDLCVLLHLLNGPPADFWETLPLGERVEPLTRDANGLAAFNKPAGILSHPNESQDEPRSLLTCRYDKEAQCFIWRAADGSARRLWLLNRLDSGTSGVILTAGSEQLAAAVREHYARKTVHKIYHALVFGRPQKNFEHWHDQLAVQKKGGQIRTGIIGNVPAQTHFQLLKHTQKAFSISLVKLEPRTGRSHQLRVQCAKRGLPIVGDQTYGDFGLNRAFAKATGQKRLFLHSLETSFSYEFAGRTHSFKARAPLPREFLAAY